MGILLDLLFLICLGSDDFTTRQVGASHLKSRGRAAIAAIRVGKQDRDPQVKRTCQMLFDDLVEGMLDDYRPLPMLDSFWYDPDQRIYNHDLNDQYRRDFDKFYPVLCSVLFNQDLGNAGPLTPDDTWWRYYLATEVWVRDVLERDDPDEIRALPGLLAELYKRDLVWYGSLERVPVNRRR
jgi:hypothetical protein